jgi:hypothetical protein
MRNLLALVGAVVVLVGGLGWYLGWYKLGVEPGTPGHPKFNVEVETDKIKDDLKKGQESVGGFLHNDPKSVEGIPTGVEKKADGTWNVPSSLKDLPAPPSAARVELNPDGTPKLSIPPPPPSFPGN